MTDAINKLFAAVHEYASRWAMKKYEDDSLIRQTPFMSTEDMRAKLLEAVDEYANRSCPLVEAPELPFTRHNFLVICESHRQLVKELDERNSPLEAKARVCDALLAEQGEDYDRAIGRAVRELREKEKMR